MRIVIGNTKNRIGFLCILLITFVPFPVFGQTPTPTGTVITSTPTPTSACPAEAASFSKWDYCERLDLPMTPPPSHGATRWYFDDCDYCRDPGNPCFTDPCTFAMYVTAECGKDFHIPLFDVETGHIRIKNCDTNTYEYLRATSTSTWNASGTEIQWEDCTGMDPLWNNQNIDIYFSDPVALCSVYRIELIDWGGFIWELMANCTGSWTPGYEIYEDYLSASRALDYRPELSLTGVTLSGICPDFPVNFMVANTGCTTTDAMVCVTTTLGGSWETLVTSIDPGAIVPGSRSIVAPTCSSPFTIITTVDCHDTVLECSESDGSVIPCGYSGSGRSAEIDYWAGSPTPLTTPTPTATTFVRIPAMPTFYVIFLVLFMMSAAWVIRIGR